MVVYCEIVGRGTLIQLFVSFTVIVRFYFSVFIAKGISGIAPHQLTGFVRVMEISKVIRFRISFSRPGKKCGSWKMMFIEKN